MRAGLVTECGDVSRDGVATLHEPGRPEWTSREWRLRGLDLRQNAFSRQSVGLASARCGKFVNCFVPGGSQDNFSAVFRVDGRIWAALAPAATSFIVTEASTSGICDTARCAPFQIRNSFLRANDRAAP
jgi:hypothetical protein